MIGHGSTPRYDYHPAQEFTAGQIGALWDLSLWRRHLFQDAAATTPVTASGQPVGCIRNALGDTSWDLIQSTAGSRPTFYIVDGVPHVHCAINTGLYSRGVQALTIPAYICGAFKHIENATIGRVMLGIYRNDNNCLYISGYNLATVAADATGVSPTRARVTAVSPQFSAPPGVHDAFDALLGGGTISVRQTDQTVIGTDVATAWVNGDTVASCTVALNAAGQNSITKVPFLNADATTTFFGGMMKMGAAPANPAACRRYFRNALDPIRVPRPTDMIVGWNSDSTGDNQNNTVVIAEPPYKIAAENLVAAYPTHSVIYVEWDRQADQLTGFQRLSTGSTDARLYVYNFCVGGSDPTYFLGERWNRSIGALPRLDFWAVNHGQNMAVASTLPDPDGYLRRGPYMMLSDRVRRAFPNARHFSILQPDVNIPGNNTMAAVRAAQTWVSNAYGDGSFLSNVVAAFVAYNPTNAYSADFQPDHVHMTDAGAARVTSVAGPDLVAFMANPPAYVAPPLIEGRKTTTNIIVNGLFDNWTGAIPTGATVTGATASRSIERVDTAKGDRTSLKVTGDGYVEFAFSVVALRGQALVFYVRQNIVAGGDLYTGALQFLDDGTGTNYHTNSWYSPLYNKVTEAWIDHYLFTKPIPNDATTGRLRLHSGAGAAGTAYFGRAVGVAGLLPKDILA
jgi:hypothetical protein